MNVDSAQQHLNVGQIVSIFLQNDPQQKSPQVMMPAIIAELNHPGVHMKQYGNTLFEYIPADNHVAFFKAFNADTGPNFVKNGKLFVVFARHALGLRQLVTQYTDPAIEQLFKIIAMNPPMPGMSYQIHPDGDNKLIELNLGG